MSPQRRSQSSTQPIPKLGPRMTKQRTAVVETLREIDKFASAKTIHEALEARGEQAGLTTVYRTLQSLSEIDAVDVLQTPEGETLYRHCLTDHHHHHLVCTTCGRSEEVEGGPVEKWAELISERFGYELVGHDAEIYGTCVTCQESRA